MGKAERRKGHFCGVPFTFLWTCPAGKTRRMSALRLDECLHVGGDGGAEGVEVVAAFEEGEEFSVAELSGPGFEEARQLDEVGVGEGELAEGVVEVGVEAGGDQDEFGFEVVEFRFVAGGEFVEDFGVAGAGGEGGVEGVAEAAPGAGFVAAAGAGVEGRLVGGEEEDGVVVVEGVLGAVAVVDVPIDDEDFADAIFFLGVAGGDGDVVEDAESAAAGLGGVVAGGADRARRRYRPGWRGGGRWR